MTVKDFIEMLKEHDENDSLYVNNGNEYFYEVLTVRKPIEGVVAIIHE